MEIVEDIAPLLVGVGKGLRAAMGQLNKSARGYLLAVGSGGELRGIMTDGDIRRFLLDGRPSLDDSKVADVMMSDFHCLREGADQRVIEEAIDRYRFVPLVDAHGVPKSVVSLSYRRLPVMEPLLGGNEEIYLLECLRSGWVSSQGRFVNEFESAFSAVHEKRPCITTSNGTTAIHLALEALGIGEGDEVIVPTLTFAASANAVVHARATPVLVDVDPGTWTLCPAATERAITPRTKAILPVHLYGHPCHMDALMELAEKHGLLVIEDCAEALGATAHGRPVGTFGHAACFSFFGNKIITTGEGGMIAFRDPAVRARAAILRDHGMSPERRYWHEEIGYNYRMTNLQAALGLAQIEKLDEILEKRRKLAGAYDLELADLPGITLPPRADWAEPICWIYTLLIDPDSICQSDFTERLSEAQIDTRAMFTPLHLMPAFTSAIRCASPNAEHLSGRGVSLPSSLALTQREHTRVIAAIRNVLAATASGKVA